ncbi:unnamed protein product [Soboliphyme baturini]|uniref:Transposase n=1 Tax=Soboliphyme baturini TaxID=241478 RepID=A0A183IK32_9BILA|nr:unnamed protein product [Soboliphyme baturini]
MRLWTREKVPRSFRNPNKASNLLRNPTVTNKTADRENVENRTGKVDASSQIIAWTLVKKIDQSTPPLTR